MVDKHAGDSLISCLSPSVSSVLRSSCCPSTASERRTWRRANRSSPTYTNSVRLPPPFVLLSSLKLEWWPLCRLRGISCSERTLQKKKNLNFNPFYSIFSFILAFDVSVLSCAGNLCCTAVRLPSRPCQSQWRLPGEMKVKKMKTIHSGAPCDLTQQPIAHVGAL